MKCPRCQHENEAGGKFCEECAAPLARMCANCGRQLSPTAKFCPDCAHPVGFGRTGAVPDRFTSPGSYTPQHLAEKILTSRAALEGERKQVTVLFADLKGSMELLADRDPEEARKILDPVLELMMEAVHRYEGTVNQVMGDGIMALFGAPLAHEDHAVRACYAALRMQESVRRYAEKAFRAHGVPIQIRVGLNSGEVVVRSIGSDLHMDYTAVGQTTHLAARMEQAAMAGSILMTADTLRLAEGYVQVTAHGAVPVKGLAAPVEVYGLAGVGPARTRLQVAAARGLTRFVGREPEMDILRRALEPAGHGHGQVVAVVGEPGVGKSRLFYEFTRSHRTHGWLLLEASSASWGKASAYFPLIDLLRSYFQVETGDDARRVREKITGKVLTLDRALEPAIPALLAILGVEDDDPRWQALDPSQRRERTVDAVKQLLLCESRVQPLLLVFEDLHWLDAESQAFLDALLDGLPTARILVLANYRPEYRHSWGSRTYYTQVRLDPLPSAGAQELLATLLGERADLGALKHLLIERTEGNPFFLEEIVRNLLETGALVRQDGGCALARPLGEIQIPATVHAVLAARIDRLAPDAKHLLQCAAIIGKDIPYPLLEAVAGMPEPTLRHGLAQVQAAELLYEAKLFPEVEYTFKHALTHEAAYAGVLQERRRRLHAEIVQAIERLYAERLGEQTEPLAHHAARGEVWAKACEYFRQLGVKAARRGAYREAVARLEEALGALSHLPESPAAIEQGIDVRLDLRGALLPLGELAQIVEHLRAAEALADRLGDRRRLGRASSFLSQYHWLMGNLDEAIASGERASAVARDLGDRRLMTTASFYLGQAHHALGRYRDARRVLEASVGVPEDSIRDRFGQSSIVANSAAWLVLCLAELGELVDGARRGEVLLRAVQAENRPFDLISACYALGHAHLLARRIDRAIPLFEQGVALVREGDFQTWAATAVASLGYAYTLAGRLADALPLLEEAASYRRAHFRLRLAYLSEAYLRAGRVEDSISVADRVLDLARRRHERGHEAWSLRLVGTVHSHPALRDLDRAESAYRAALTLATDLGMQPVVALCHGGLARVLRSRGDAETAEAHLDQAVALATTIGMEVAAVREEAEQLHDGRAG